MALYVLVGCGDRPVTEWVPPPDIESWAEYVPRGAIYVDATPSQQGFATGGSAAYESLPDDLRRAASSLVDSIRFYRFGTELETLDWSAFRRFGVDEGFYGAGPAFRDTRIDNVVESADPSQLSIVVTDLFQDASDMTVLAERLRERFLARGAAVGMTGLKAQFEGMVYDVGVRRSSVAYSGGRPLYIIVMGPPGVVARYIEHLIEGARDEAEAHALIFGPLTMRRVGSSADAEVDSTRSANETTGLYIGSTRDRRLRQFNVLDVEGGTVTMTVPFELGPFARPFDARELGASAGAYRIEEEEPVWSDSTTASVQRAFRVRTLASDERHVRVGLEVSGLELTETDPGLYYVAVSVYPRQMAYTWPPWVREWNADSGDPFDGAQTLNLENLLGDLHEAAVGSEPPLVAKLHYLINVPG